MTSFRILSLALIALFLTALPLTSMSSAQTTNSCDKRFCVYTKGETTIVGMVFRSGPHKNTIRNCEDDSYNPLVPKYTLTPLSIWECPGPPELAFAMKVARTGNQQVLGKSFQELRLGRNVAATGWFLYSGTHVGTFLDCRTFRYVAVPHGWSISPIQAPQLKCPAPAFKQAHETIVLPSPK